MGMHSIKEGGMMGDLISRKLISDYLREQHAQVIIEKYKDGFITDDVCKGMECSIDAFVNFISQCPTVDAKPVVHGEWIKVNVGLFNDDEKNNGYVCSSCETGWWNVEEWNFCPTCGAKMDGKKVQE